MPIGYVTANQGESRYTVAIPRKTPLLAALIEARRVEIEGIDRALEELRKHEAERREVYDATMAALGEATASYTECRESYTELQCCNAKIAAANSAYSDARDECIDTWQACRFACDIGDGDCQDACDDAREACELAAETARDRALAAVDRLCADAVVAHLAACQKEWAPIIAAAQAAATEALAPLQDAMIAITWERTKRTAAVRRLNELEAIEASAETATAWSAQYNNELPAGEVPEEPTGAEDNAVTVATVSGRAVITAISSATPCVHDARALPSEVLFVDAALAPGVETWRPTWRTGTVTAIYDPANPGDWPNPEKPLRVRIDPAILPRTLGTRVSRRNIECTPPGAFFDERGELDARLGIARQEYDDAIEARDEILAEIATCKSTYTVEACTVVPNETCTNNRDASLLACADLRDECLTMASDADGVQYCLDQYAACVDQVGALFSACVDGVTADCIAAKAQHDTQCEQASQFALSQAETAVSAAQRNLINASADIQGPPAELLLDVAVGHCVANRYMVGDDVLIDFPARAASTGIDWSTATSEQIRAAAMAVWQSAQVVGWASDTRQCAAFLLVAGGTSYLASFGNGRLSLAATSRTGGYFGPWQSGAASWDTDAVYRPEKIPFPPTVLAASRNFELRLVIGPLSDTVVLSRHGVVVGSATVPRLSNFRGGFIHASPNYSTFSPDETRVSVGIPASYASTTGASPFVEHYYGGRVYELDFTHYQEDGFALSAIEIMGDEHDRAGAEALPWEGLENYSGLVAEKRGLLSVSYADSGLVVQVWLLRETQSRAESSYSTGEAADTNVCASQSVETSGGSFDFSQTFDLIIGDFIRSIYSETIDKDWVAYDQYLCVYGYGDETEFPETECQWGSWRDPTWDPEHNAYRWKCDSRFGGTVATNIRDIKKDYLPAILFDGQSPYLVSFGKFDLVYDQGFDEDEMDVIAIAHEKAIQCFRLDGPEDALFSAPAEYWSDNEITDGEGTPWLLSFTPYRLIQKGSDFNVQQERRPSGKYGYAKSTANQTFFGIVDESEDHPVQAYFVVEPNSAVEVELPGVLTKLSVGS